MGFLLSLHSLSDVALLLLRLGLAAIFLTHGKMKMAMWKMQPSAQMPASMISVMRLLSICEPLGGIAMIFGFLTQPAALGFMLIMLGAIHLKSSKMKKTFAGDGGWEFDFIILLSSFVILVMGAGAFSLDRMLFGL